MEDGGIVSVAPSCPMYHDGVSCLRRRSSNDGTSSIPLALWVSYAEQLPWTKVDRSV